MAVCGSKKFSTPYTSPILPNYELTAVQRDNFGEDKNSVISVFSLLKIFPNKATV